MDEIQQIVTQPIQEPKSQKKNENIMVKSALDDQMIVKKDFNQKESI